MVWYKKNLSLYGILRKIYNTYGQKHQHKIVYLIPEYLVPGVVDFMLPVEVFQVVEVENTSPEPAPSPIGIHS